MTQMSFRMPPLSFFQLIFQFFPINFRVGVISRTQISNLFCPPKNVHTGGDKNDYRCYWKSTLSLPYLYKQQGRTAGRSCPRELLPRCCREFESRGRNTRLGTARVAMGPVTNRRRRGCLTGTGGGAHRGTGTAGTWSSRNMAVSETASV